MLREASWIAGIVVMSHVAAVFLLFAFAYADPTLRWPLLALAAVVAVATSVTANVWGYIVGPGDDDEEAPRRDPGRLEATAGWLAARGTSPAVVTLWILGGLLVATAAAGFVGGELRGALGILGFLLVAAGALWGDLAGAKRVGTQDR